MRVRFWGTRGSIATPGPTTLRYGGNTSCVEVETASGTRIVLDCGTGARPLGQHLLSSRVTRGHLLITHTHWDHIQGFPFFAPLFVPGNEWDVYAPGAAAGGLEAVLRGQMEYTYFPVTLDQLGATLRFHDLSEGTFNVEEVRVTAQHLNHPAVALGYRLEVGGVSMAYSTDHEPHSRHQAEPESDPRAGATPILIHAEDERHSRFLAGADLAIHDAQYTAAEYDKKVGWGHSTVEYAVDLAVAAGVKWLVLFHHDPLRNDSALDEVLQSASARARAWGSQLEVTAAAEGETIDLAEVGSASMEPARADATTILTGVGTAKVLVVDDDPDTRSFVSLALRSEGYRLLAAPDGETALALAREHRPDLILLDWTMPGMDGLAVCRALRADADAGIRGVPIVMLTGRVRPEETREGFEVGADDYLTKPFTPAHLRTRVRQWLERGRAARAPL